MKKTTIYFCGSERVKPLAAKRAGLNLPLGTMWTWTVQNAQTDPESALSKNIRVFLFCAKRFHRQKKKQV